MITVEDHEETRRTPRRRPARGPERRQAIAVSRGIRRHRTHEREV